MEGAGKAEGDWPGEGAVTGYGCEIIGGLFGGLTTGEEDDTGEFGGDVVFKDFGGFGTDFFGGRLGFILFAGKDHTALEDASAEVDFVFGEFGEESIEDVTGDFGGLIDGVVAIINNFGFYDGDDASGLAFGGVFGEDPAVFVDGVVGGSKDFAIVIEADFKSSTPFGESETHLVVFL